MAKFAVGTRVRVAWVRNSEFSGDVGKEGRITQIDSSGDGPVIYGLDSAPIEYRNGWLQIRVYGFTEDQLEPILPEGAAPSIYSYQELMEKLREGERV